MKKIMFLSINIVIGITLVMVMVYPVANVKGEAFTMWNEYVSMRDGVLLNTKIFLPDPDVWGNGPYPTLLTRTPYGIGEPNAYGDKNGDVPGPAYRGYVCVIQDVRGRWYSEGVDRLFYDDAKDGYDTVEWIASQPWSNGKVGQYGASATACTTYLTASENPPHLIAGYAMAGSANLYNGFLFEGGAFRYATAYQWGLDRIPHLSQSHLDTVVPTDETSNIPYHLSVCSQILADLSAHRLTSYPKRPTDSTWCMHTPLKGYSYSLSTLQPWWDKILSHPSKDSFRDHMDLIDKINIPIIHVGAWYDMFGVSLIEVFTSLQHKGNQKIIVGGGTHLDLEIPNIPFYGWFDYWLKGKDTGVMDTPAVTYYCLGENEWEYASEWLTNKLACAYFHENGVLDTEKCRAGEKPDSYIYDPTDPVITWGGRNLCLPAGAFDQRPVQQGRSDILTYKSATLSNNIKITGNVKVVLSVSSNCSDTDFTAKLMDVTSNGETILVLDGIQRARYRQSMSDPQLMNEGTVYQIIINLGDISYVFKQGHKIQVDISSSNFPKYDRNLNTGGCLYNETLYNIALNTVCHDNAYKSYIMLPTELTLPDCDGDYDVDSADLFMLAPAYGSSKGDPLYNPACDFDGDDDVDSVDLFTLAANYGKVL